MRKIAHRLDDLVRPAGVILWNSSGTLTLFGFELPSRYVLPDGHRLCGARVGRRVRGSAEADHLASPSATRSSTPPSGTRAGASARRVARRWRSTAVRSPSAPDCGRLFAPVVANYKRYVNRMIGFYGWNLSLDPDHRAAAVPAAVPAVLHRRDYPRRHDVSPRRRSAASRTGCRSSVMPTTLRRGTARRSSVCRAWSSPTRKGRRCPQVTTAAYVDGTVAARRRRARCRTPDGKQLVEPAEHAPAKSATPWWSPASPAAGKTTLLRSLAELSAVHDGHPDPAMRAQRDDVPVPDSPTYHLAICGPSCTYPRARRATVDDVDLARRAARGRAAASRRPARRGAGLGQGALPRRATANRIRARPAGQAQRSIPRRVHVRAGRGPGVHRSTNWSGPSCRTPSLVSVSHRTAPSSSTTRTNSSLLGDGEWRPDRGRHRGSDRGLAVATRPMPGSVPAWRCSHPSLDWGNDIVGVTALWVAKAWAIGAVSMVAVLALLARFTTWGTAVPGASPASYFTGRQSIPVWALLGVLLLGDGRRAVSACCSATRATISTPRCRRRSTRRRQPRKMLPSTASGSQYSILVGLAVTDIVRITARPVSDAALHHPVAGVAQPIGSPGTGSTVTPYYRGRFLIGDTGQRSTIRTNASSRTSTSSPPAPARRPTRRRSARRRPWCSARCLASSPVVSFTPILWSLAGPLTILRASPCPGRCSGWPCCTCSSRRSSRSGSAAR